MTAITPPARRLGPLGRAAQYLHADLAQRAEDQDQNGGRARPQPAADHVPRAVHLRVWLQAFVKVNPMTFLTEAERGLLIGGPVAATTVRSLLWALGIFVVFAPLAVRAYRRRT